jgi:hypothetical protein
LEVTIKTLATKDDVKDISVDFEDLRQHIRQTCDDLIKWMFFFWINPGSCDIYYLFIVPEKIIGNVIK